MKHGGMLLALLLWAQSSLAGPIELKQLVDFKWRGLTVATMKFSVSIPTAEKLGVSDEERGAAFEPMVLLELEGQTKGPLRWFEDYQATVRYLQMDAQGLTNAFTLSGTDNGDAEQRHIVFDLYRLPEIRLFVDSTAEEALAPHDDWLGNTINPLGVFKRMLLAAAQQESCEADVWGYDGKRRYRLTLRDVAHPQASTRSDGAAGQLPEVTHYAYACELTMHAEGRQSATGRTAKPSFMASRFAGLWPFNDGDRRMTFVIRVQPIVKGNGVLRLVLADVRIMTRIGAIVGSSVP